MSSRLDERLRDGFATLAETVPTASPDAAQAAIEARAQRRQDRGVRRPAIVAFAVVTLVVALAIGGTWWIGRDDSPEPRPAEQPSPPTSLPSCHETTELPCDEGDGNAQLTENVVVATGERDGAPWQLEAYYSEAGLCYGLRVGPGRGGSCGFGVPPLALNVGQSWQIGFGASAQGVVRKDAALVRLELSNGDTIETAPVGADAGFEVNFFVAYLPDDVDVLRGIAFNADGQELGRQEIPQMSEPPEIQDTPPPE